MRFLNFSEADASGSAAVTKNLLDSNGKRLIVEDGGIETLTEPVKSNVYVCNSFIEACIKKSSIDMLTLYFNAVSEKLEDGG